MLDNDNVKKEQNLLSIPNSNEDVTTLIDENPEYVEGVNEPQELSDEEKEKLRIEQIKSYHLRYATKKHFGVKYKKERARKNRASKKSKKANRK